MDLDLYLLEVFGQNYGISEEVILLYLKLIIIKKQSVVLEFYQMEKEF
jgi:hypothetical protein